MWGASILTEPWSNQAGRDSGIQTDRQAGGRRTNGQTFPVVIWAMRVAKEHDQEERTEKRREKGKEIGSRNRRLGLSNRSALYRTQSLVGRSVRQADFEQAGRRAGRQAGWSAGGWLQTLQVDSIWPQATSTGCRLACLAHSLRAWVRSHNTAAATTPLHSTISTGRQQHSWRNYPPVPPSAAAAAAAAASNSQQRLDRKSNQQ